MNAGSEPERDDFGLPPVDIEIPDDARELDRDVQAYQRELRALRRRQRARRLRGPLTRDGMVLPLLAGCLILALLTSTLLIMFAADQTGRAGAAAAHRQRSSERIPRPDQPAAGQIGGQLPAAAVSISGKAVPLQHDHGARAVRAGPGPGGLRVRVGAASSSAPRPPRRTWLVYFVGTARR